MVIVIELNVCTFLKKQCFKSFLVSVQIPQRSLNEGILLHIYLGIYLT